jgi:hypothetical protein
MFSDTDIQWIGLVVAGIALMISVIALVYTVLTYLLKSGHKLRCDISTCSSMDCDDDYVSSITLENLKDRATVIFDIYLRLGLNNYIHIEGFENSPLILKPFEVYHKTYDPVVCYVSSFDPISIKNIIRKRRSSSIVLSTTDGKYTVKTATKHWRPVSLFFKNYLTRIISPSRVFFKGKAYGGNIKFLVVLKFPDNSEEVVSLREDDYQLAIFKNFSLTRDSLKSKSSLLAFFELQRQRGNITAESVEVVDFRQLVRERLNSYERQQQEITLLTWFQYHIMGRIFTFIEKRRLRKLNKKNKKS